MRGWLLDRFMDHGAEFHCLLGRDLAARDARDVQQVVDQPGHVLTCRSMTSLALIRGSCAFSMVAAGRRC